MTARSGRPVTNDSIAPIAPIAATAIAAIAAAIATISAAAVANAAASDAHPPSSSLSFFPLPWECFLQFSVPRPALSGKPVLLNRRDGSKREHQI